MPQIQFLVNFDDNTVLHSFKVDTLEELKDGLRSSYPALGAFTISYYDDEGDCIKVTSQPEFAEALNAAEENGDFLSILLNIEAPKAPEVVAPSAQPESALPPSPLDILHSLLGGKIAAAQPLVQNFFQNAEAAGSELPGFLEEAAQNFLPMIQNGIKDIEPLLRNVSGEISAAAERASSAIQAEVAAHREVPVQVEVSVPVVSVPVPEVVEEKPVAQQPRVAHHAICDSCGDNIYGIRYKCLHCPDYDLCEVCEATNLEKNTHDSEHVFAKLYRTEQRSAPIFRHGHGHMQRGARCGGKFGGRRRMDKLEQDILVLQQQINDLLAKKIAKESQPEEVPVPVPEEREVVIEDVLEEEEEQVEEVEEVDEDVISEDTQQILDMLSAMGFADKDTNLAVITAHDGNVEMVLETLLNGNF